MTITETDLDDFLYWLVLREHRLRQGKTVFQCYSHSGKG